LGGTHISLKYSHTSTKDHPCAETHHLSHKAWTSVQQFDLGAGSNKKGKQRQSKKVTRW